MTSLFKLRRERTVGEERSIPLVPLRDVPFSDTVCNPNIYRRLARTRVPLLVRDAGVGIERLVADLLEANHVARRLRKPDGSALHFSIGWHSQSMIMRSPDKLFYLMSRVNPSLTRRFGAFCVDVDEVVLPRQSRRGSARGRSRQDDVVSVKGVRGISIERFYSVLLPALQQAVWGMAEGQFHEECCVCFSEVVQMQTPCGHKFCENCMDQILAADDTDRRRCPLCREQLNRDSSSVRDSWVLAGSVAGMDDTGTRDEDQIRNAKEKHHTESVSKLHTIIDSLPLQRANGQW